MYHFRLRRRMRRLVDDLSWSFAEFLLSAQTAFFIRTISPRRATSGGQRSRRARYFRQRYLTLIVLLLTLSLEICGCDVAQEPVLELSSLASPQTMRSYALAEHPPFFYDPADIVSATSPEPFLPDELNAPVQHLPLQAKPLPWAIPESVFLVYKGGDRSITGRSRLPVATAFVISVPDSDHHGALRLLITARHVVDPEWAHCAARNPASILLRLNRRSGGVGYRSVPLRLAHGRNYFTSSDPTADIVAIRLDKTLIADLDDYKFLDVPSSMLPTAAEALQFQTDQPVMTARIPSSSQGESGNFPVFNAGVLATMSSESVNVRCDPPPGARLPLKPLHVWLVNVRVPQGASGAPVYAAINRGVDAVKTPVLLGVQAVAWPEQGVAAVTPAIALSGLIHSVLRDRNVHREPSTHSSAMTSHGTPSLY